MPHANLRPIVLVSLLGTGCAQISGVDDYHLTPAHEAGVGPAVADEPGEDGGTEPELDAALSNPDAGPSGGDLDARVVDADAPALDDPDAGIVVNPSMSDPSMMGSGDSGAELDAEARCEAPMRMCDTLCVAADDLHHCGACGHDCTGLPNVAGEVSCVAGECVVPSAACAPGFAHCSDEADDGCEVNIREPAHCGGCDVSCSDPSPLCSAGASAGTYACASNCAEPAPTQCGDTCVDTDSSPSHCGKCDRACPQVDRGTPVCKAGNCDFTCNGGHHRCGSACLPNDSPSSCGSSCTPCTAPGGATAICTGAGTCDFVCKPNYHRCGDACLPNDSPSSCGSSCTPCTAPGGATAICTGAGTCDFNCSTSQHRCGNQCVSNDSPGSCGASCTPCNAPGDATAICTAAGACDFTCNSGHHRCGDACAPDDSTTQCGPSCQLCPQVEAGTPICVAGACGVKCDPGATLIDGACKPTNPAKQLAVGEDHTCAVMADSTVRCWGSNQDFASVIKYQLGPAATKNISKTPVKVTGLANVTQLTAGASHTCAVSSGKVVCWGDNQYWQLGAAAVGVSSSATPVTVAGLSDLLQIEATSFETCALLGAGGVSCWGSRNGGPLVSSHGDSNVTRISYGGTVLCERQATGAVRCSGTNTYGQIGQNPDDLPSANSPLTVPGVSNVTDITTGTYNVCAVTTGGKVWCWGTYSAVGPHQTGTTPALPAEIPGLSNIRGVASGYTSTCAWSASGSVYCWGSNASGKLGQPTSLDESRTPLQVPNLSDVVELGIGNHHVCARTSDGWVKCWGTAFYGQLGPAATSNYSEVPLTVAF